MLSILHDVKNFSKWTSCEVCSRGPWEGPHELDLMDFISKIIGFQQIYHEVSFQILVSRENLVLWWQISCHFQELKIRKSSYIYSKNTLVSIECFCHYRLESFTRSLIHICQHKVQVLWEGQKNLVLTLLSNVKT